MSTSNGASDDDNCPYCLQPFQIVAVSFNLLRAARALMVCSDCGLIQAEQKRPLEPRLRAQPQATRR
jgi:transcription initiation factor TFIIIB Brf1 subunit/transcription initiation factor TFIIB